MKRWICFLCFAALFMAVSCSDSSTNKNDNSIPADADTAVTDETGDDTVIEPGDDTVVTEEEPTTDDAIVTDETSDETDDETPDEASDEMGDEDVVESDEDTVNPLLAQFVGTWAEKLVLVSDTQTIIGNVESTTTRYKLGKITLEDGELHIENKICKIDNTTSQGDTIFYQKYCDIYWFWHPYELKNPKPDITVTEGSGTITFVENRSWELRGMLKMNDPETDTIPNSANDERIFDHDEDGHPAFTLGFTSALIKGDMYLVQRLSHELTGTYIPGDGIYGLGTSPDRIEGGVNWTDDQYTVDATNPTLKSQKKSTIRNEDSTFIYVRVPDDFTCDEVYDQREQLFGN